MFVDSCSPVIATDSKSAGEGGREGKAAFFTFISAFTAFSASLVCPFLHENRAEELSRADQSRRDRV